MPRSVNPRRPHGPRDPGDAWVEGDRGRFWGRFGAAGLLAHDPARGILLQHRVEWSDQGGTWGLPGGARHEGEDAITGALREAHEEARVPASALTRLFTHVFDVGYWTYTTVGMLAEPFEAEISDPESVELRWVRPERVGDLPLHSGFAAAWPALRSQLERPDVVVVDAANVVGSKPDGWWRDRAGAAARLLTRVRAVARAGIPGSAVGSDLERVWPEWVVVLEGRARAAVSGETAADSRVRVVSAPGEGDDEIVAQAAERAEGASVTVVTSDRGLRERVGEVGAAWRGVRWFDEVASGLD